ncbi:MAG: GspH/FimT family pseudopilin [Smithellaceae bacterium]
MKIRKNSGGFSLVELIIVMAIMGIVAAIAAPNFTRYRDNTNLREAARDIVSDIQFYKQKAVSENVTYRITFSGNNYTIAKQPPAAWETIATKVVGLGNSAIDIYDSSAFPSGINLQSRGTITPSGTLKLKHTRRDSEASIKTYTMGRVEVTYVLK